MRTLHLTSHESPPALSELPVPQPGPGQIGVRIGACGLNFADLLMLTGAYQATPEAPFTAGMELSGTVRAVGRKVDGVFVGDRVAAFAGSGAFADQAIVRRFETLLARHVDHAELLTKIRASYLFVRPLLQQAANGRVADSGGAEFYLSRASVDLDELAAALLPRAP